MGLEPWEFSLRELAWMARAKDRATCEYQSLLLSVMNNLHNKKQLPPAAFNPYTAGEWRGQTLKAALSRGGKP